MHQAVRPTTSTRFCRSMRVHEDWSEEFVQRGASGKKAKDASEHLQAMSGLAWDESLYQWQSERCII